MQSSWEAFIRDTHPITDQNECIRLGDALDSQLGLLSDELQYVRIGSVYVSIGFGGYPIVVGLDGKVITVFRSQD